MVLFLGSLFCSIDLCFCSYASTRLFRLQCLYHSLVSGIVIPPTLFFFSQDCRSYLGSIIWFDIYFWNIGSRYVKHTTGIFIRIALNLYIALYSMDILVMLIIPIHEHILCFHFFISSLISFFMSYSFLNTGLLPPQLN